MLTVKIGKDEQQEKDRAVEQAVIGFVETKAKMDALKTELDGYKDALAAKAEDVLNGSDTSTITFGVDDDKVKITFGYDVKVKDVEALREILGERFDDLVAVKTDYKPETKLKEMAIEDDGLAECMTVKPKAPAVAVVK